MENCFVQADHMFSCKHFELNTTDLQRWRREFAFGMEETWATCRAIFCTHHVLRLSLHALGFLLHSEVAMLFFFEINTYWHQCKHSWETGVYQTITLLWTHISRHDSCCARVSSAGLLGTLKHGQQHTVRSLHKTNAWHITEGMSSYVQRGCSAVGTNATTKSDNKFVINVSFSYSSWTFN